MATKIIGEPPTPLNVLPGDFKAYPLDPVSYGVNVPGGEKWSVMSIWLDIDHTGGVISGYLRVWRRRDFNTWDIMYNVGIPTDAVKLYMTIAPGLDTSLIVDAAGTCSYATAPWGGYVPREGDLIQLNLTSGAMVTGEVHVMVTKVNP